MAKEQFTLEELEIMNDDWPYGKADGRRKLTEVSFEKGSPERSMSSCPQTYTVPPPLVCSLPR